jgi:outer membrane protein assembly factor BamD
MIETYPDSDLLDEAKTALRAVQEVLADGVNGVGNYYMLHRNYAAAVSRYKEIATKYPDYPKCRHVIRLGRGITARRKRT